jgi:hypothetical protein
MSVPANAVQVSAGASARIGCVSEVQYEISMQVIASPSFHSPLEHSFSKLECFHMK